MSFGDFSTVFDLRGNGVDYAPMPTAIVRLYTPEGWVIAADGRKGNTETGEVWDDTQKIFPICGPGKSLAYAIAGDAGISDHTHRNIGFSFLTEMANAVCPLPTSNADDLMTFAEHISKPVYERLCEARRNDAIVPFREIDTVREPPHPGFTIASVFFAGFYSGAPSAVRVRFFHRRQNPGFPRVFFESLLQGRQPQIYGSPVVGNLLCKTEDPRFARWRTIPTGAEFTTIANAAAWAKNYISACASEAGRQEDPETCNAIGGHIHIATISPTTGFHWLVAPLKRHQESNSPIVQT